MGSGDLFLPPPERLTHAQLVEMAARWLRGTRKCSLVATERRDAFGSECPDAIGWTPRGLSVLVEAKTTVGDFYADRRKPSRCGAAALGRERWYLTEPGLLEGKELPPGWGWLEIRAGRVFRKVAATPAELTPGDAVAELSLMVALTRRALSGISDGVTLGEASLESAEVDRG